MVDFIGVYDKAAPPDMCKKIIDFFEDNKNLQFRGRHVVDGLTMINKHGFKLYCLFLRQSYAYSYLVL